MTTRKISIFRKVEIQIRNVKYLSLTHKSPRFILSLVNTCHSVAVGIGHVKVGAFSRAIGRCERSVIPRRSQ